MADELDVPFRLSSPNSIAEFSVMVRTTSEAEARNVIERPSLKIGKDNELTSVSEDHRNDGPALTYC